MQIASKITFRWYPSYFIIYNHIENDLKDHRFSLFQHCFLRSPFKSLYRASIPSNSDISATETFSGGRALRSSSVGTISSWINYILFWIRFMRFQLFRIFHCLKHGDSTWPRASWPGFNSQASKPASQPARVQHNNNNNNNKNGALVARVGLERSFPTMRHDTLRDRRKGDP